ncbi:MAG: HNH endonuclease [Algibacter sp.]|uniref:HNH endonuclease n=1 Tax=Algibacter sp. TaxID=1872428 RepID=UPI00261CB61A|nr:HNH endonuclease [Algibacter sp.]MDG1729986.1 HNH endonuclease [Algibacter sp.]MDG2177228.1 HNH endonuclease [Algibacter sp.]
MATELTKTEWIEILLDEKITNEMDMLMFQSLYSFQEQKAPASQIGLLMGYTGKNTAGPLNLEIGRYAKRISEFYKIDFTARSARKYKYWDLFFNGWEDEPFFIWQLRPELKKALEEIEMTGEVQFAEEIPSDLVANLKEGHKKMISVNVYERNPRARAECIKHWKALCNVCEFNFEKTYGEIGKGFVHVHHLIPISEIGKTYQVDPINDLRPVCPNCHAMLHKENPPLEINVLRELIKDNKI